MEDEPEQEALFELQGPDDDGCVRACPADSDVWCQNLGPTQKVAGEARGVASLNGPLRTSSAPIQLFNTSAKLPEVCLRSSAIGDGKHAWRAVNVTNAFKENAPELSW